MPFSYRLGSSFGLSIIPLIISIFTLFFCFKKKLSEGQKYRYPKGIFIAIACFIIVGSIFTFIKYYNEKTSKELVEKIMSGEVKIKSETNSESESEPELDPENEALYQEIVAENFHKEMEDAAKSCSDELPEYAGNGISVIKCEIEEKSMVYTVRVKGASRSSITDEVLAGMKKDIIEGFKEESASWLDMVSNMKEYGYNFKYKYINEKGSEICSITISPSEILN